MDGLPDLISFVPGVIRTSEVSDNPKARSCCRVLLFYQRQSAKSVAGELFLFSDSPDPFRGSAQRQSCPPRSPVVTSEASPRRPVSRTPSLTDSPRYGMRVLSPPGVRSAPVALATIALLALAGSARAQAPNTPSGVWAITNARIETVTKGMIEKGTIIIRNGLIEAVGTNVPVPADARVLDAAGKRVYPGIIDLTSSLGLPNAPAAGQGRGPGGGVGAAPQAAAASDGPQWVGLDPQRMVATELRPQQSDIKAERDAGVTAVLVAPTRGAFRGQSTLLPLRDDTAQDHLLKNAVALHMGFQPRSDGTGFGGGKYPGTLLGVIAYERQAFYDAERQAQIAERYRQNPRGMTRPESDPALDALAPALKGTMPVFFIAGNENEIRRAARIAKEFNLKLTVVGATEGFRAIDAIKGVNANAVVSVDFPKAPEVTGWSYRTSQRHSPADSAAADAAVTKMVQSNAATLSAAGVKVALASGGLRGSEFLANVRKAIAGGLSKDAALSAITIRPAELVGAAEQLGSIETGKIANLVVVEGDLLEESGKVRTVFVDGMRYDVAATPAVRANGTSRTSGSVVQVAGAWALTVSSPQGEQPSTLNITQNGETISGTMTSQNGTVPVTGGSVSGRTMTWSISLPIGGQVLEIHFTGDVDDTGSRIKGTAELGTFGNAPFSGEKRP